MSVRRLYTIELGAWDMGTKYKTLGANLFWGSKVKVAGVEGQIWSEYDPSISPELISFRGSVNKIPDPLSKNVIKRNSVDLGLPNFT